MSTRVALVKRLRELEQEERDLTQLAAEYAAADSADGVAMREMAEQELHSCQQRRVAAEDEMMRHLLPRDEADARSSILEVRAGVGGNEAALFAMELFGMYRQYCAACGWQFETLACSETAEGGAKEASAAITGHGVFGRLKYETGVHRVQRVPQTESQGRTHTSTVTVAVLPQAEEVDVELRQQDLRIECYRASGRGGQHVNTTDSAVRITHLPTGTMVAIQDERSQLQNKAKALKLLRARLYEAERQRIAAERARMRKEQIGTGDRSERIRTYNFNQSRVTDHRVNLTKHDVDAMMRGEVLDEFIDALAMADQLRQLEALKVDASQQ